MKTKKPYSEQIKPKLLKPGHYVQVSGFSDWVAVVRKKTKAEAEEVARSDMEYDKNTGSIIRWKYRVISVEKGDKVYSY